MVVKPIGVFSAQVWGCQEKVTPVLEEDGCLVTSDKAFDMIAGENIGISKHILCGMLSRAQRRPLLKKRQGKLYLEVNET